LIPLKLALPTVATPLLLVVAEPAEEPLRVKLMLLPLTPEPSEVLVSVAVRLTVPPKVPVALLTARLVGAVTVSVALPLLLACEELTPP
jgi:hypothetical protein